MSLTQVSRLARYTPFVLLLALIALPIKADLSTHRSPARTEVEKVPLQQQALDASMGEALRHARYDIKWAERSSLPAEQSAYGASNPAQSFYSHFTPDGLHLADSSRPDKAWQMRLNVDSVGYGTRQQSVSDGRLTASGNRIEYSRDLTATQSAIRNYRMVCEPRGRSRARLHVAGAARSWRR